MIGIGLKIGETIKVILAVLGIISAYPEVNSEIENIFIYRNLKNAEIVDMQFRSYNLINPAIRDIIEGGIDVNIIYQIKTTFKNNIIYRGLSNQKISYKGGIYSVNNKGNFDFNILTNVISVNEVPILTNASSFTNCLMRTEIKLLINCDATPEIINLWGNKPKYYINFVLGVNNEN